MREKQNTTTVARPVDGAALRRAVGHFCTGVTVVTALDDADQPIGFTCQSFVSLSLDPPLVMFSVSRGSLSWPQIRVAGRFCVNILAADQGPLCSAFATKGVDRFTGVDWLPGPTTGSPVLLGSLAWVECTIEAVYPGGDHVIAVGRVRDIDVAHDGADPLLYFRGTLPRPAP